MKTTIPPLKAGDLVALAAPARRVSPDEMAPTIATLQSWGLRVRVPEGLYADEGQLAGSDNHRAALFGSEEPLAWEPHPLNRPGKAEGLVVGGNLSILYSLLGSHSQIDTRGKILLIEDLDEYLYHVDRMMQALRRAGMLKELKGLIVGHLSDMHDNAVPFGKTAEEIVLDAIRDHHFPVAFGAPIGHWTGANCAIRLGEKYRLECANSKNSCIFAS